MKIRYLVIIAAICAAVYGGMRYEATAIQQTCEADDAATVLNGTPYLCLSQRQIDLMRAQQQQKGA